MYILSKLGLKSLQAKATALIVASTLLFSAIIYMAAYVMLLGADTESGDIHDQSLSIVFSAGGILLVFSVGIGIAISRSINRKLEALIRVSEQVAAGSLGARGT